MTRSLVVGFRPRTGIRLLVGLLLAVAALVPAGCKLVTVRPLNEAGVPQGPSSSQRPFDPVVYVDGIWESKVLPTVVAKAVDLPLLLPALRADPEAAGKQYGYREGTGAYNFLVKGQGEILSVNTESRVGLITIDLMPVDGKADVAVQIGPVLRGVSVRDGVGFISFNEFVNQLQFADVANEINNRVLQTVLNGLDPAALQGRSITVYGAFTLEGDSVVITPLKLDLGGQ